MLYFAAMFQDARPVSVREEFRFTPGEQVFMRTYLTEDLIGLLLRSGWTTREKMLLQQVALRQKIRYKLPGWYHNMELFMPPVLSLQQASSSEAAAYKSALVSGDRFFDLCCGMGIDASYFAGQFNEGVLFEKNETLAGITSHNLAILKPGAKLFMLAGADAAEVLRTNNENADLIYSDPARRDEKGNKVSALRNTEPDIPALQQRIMQLSPRLLVKTSPLQDISQACRELQGVKQVWVYGSGNECRELLFDCRRNLDSEIGVHVTIPDRSFEMRFLLAEENEGKAETGMPGQYLYEPDACILKAGAFNTIAAQFKILKLHRHTHLYTSDSLLPGFPGRMFSIQGLIKPDAKAISSIVGKTAHLAIRNFPGNVAELRKKWKLAEGGDDYLFACTLADSSKTLIHARKVSAVVS